MADWPHVPETLRFSIRTIFRNQASALSVTTLTSVLDLRTSPDAEQADFFIATKYGRGLQQRH